MTDDEIRARELLRLKDGWHDEREADIAAALAAIRAPLEAEIARLKARGDAWFDAHQRAENRLQDANWEAEDARRQTWEAWERTVEAEAPDGWAIPRLVVANKEIARLKEEQDAWQARFSLRWSDAFGEAFDFFGIRARQLAEALAEVVRLKENHEADRKMWAHGVTRAEEQRDAVKQRMAAEKDALEAQVVAVTRERDAFKEEVEAWHEKLGDCAGNHMREKLRADALETRAGELEAQVVALLEALEGVRDGTCWCQYGVSLDEEVKFHDEDCRRAEQALTAGDSLASTVLTRERQAAREEALEEMAKYFEGECYQTVAATIRRLATQPGRPI